MATEKTENIQWKEHQDAVERGFVHYLALIERSLRGERVSLEQGLIDFFSSEFDMHLRRDQTRGLRHRSGGAFKTLLHNITGEAYLPVLREFREWTLDEFFTWRSQFIEKFYEARGPIGPVPVDLHEEDRPADRVNVSIRRIIRDSKLSIYLKELYQHKCQICGFRIDLSNRQPYSETHHIRPLGEPHNGPDTIENMIVLCPNHHAMMDLGVIAIDPDKMTVVGCNKSNKITLHDDYIISREFLQYHLDKVFGKI